MDSFRFLTFLLASLAGHAALLVPLSAYMPALLDPSEFEADTVLVTIRVESHAEHQNRDWSEMGEPYQPLEDVVVPEQSEPIAVQGQRSNSPVPSAAPEQAALQKAATAKVKTPVESESQSPQPYPRQAPVDEVAAAAGSPRPERAERSLASQASLEVEANKRRQLVAEERYLTDLLNAIAIHRFYPDGARRRGQQGSVEVQLTILKNGEFKSIAVSKPSNYRTLNKASTRTLNRLKRFKPFPRDIDRDSWKISIPFRYVLSSRQDKRS